MSVRSDLAVLQSQMHEMSRDVADMRSETREWQAKHEAAHETEREERLSGRRWVAGSAIAGLASMAAVVGMFVELLSRIH